MADIELYWLKVAKRGKIVEWKAFKTYAAMRDYKRLKIGGQLKPEIWHKGKFPPSLSTPKRVR